MPPGSLFSKLIENRYVYNSQMNVNESVLFLSAMNNWPMNVNVVHVNAKTG